MCRRRLLARHKDRTREGGRGRKGEGGWEGGRKRYLCVVVLGGKHKSRRDGVVRVGGKESRKGMGVMEGKGTR